MSWITTPIGTVWPAGIASDGTARGSAELLSEGDERSSVRLTLITNERATHHGTCHVWTPQQRRALLRLDGAFETDAMPDELRDTSGVLIT